MFIIDNHKSISFLRNCRVLTWLSELDSSAFRTNIMATTRFGTGSCFHGITKRPLDFVLRPARPCENCWETFIPHSSNQHGSQKYCSDKCSKQVIAQRAVENRKQSLIDGTGTAFLKLRFTVLRRDKFTCQYCGRTPKDGAKLNLDHIQPKSKDGKLTVSNLITSCVECNQGKRDVVLSEREQERLKL